jgi:RNase P/RNase MRP subunit p30
VNNLLSLLRFCNGKGLVISSEAAKPIEMRSPSDAINLYVPISYLIHS